MNWVSVIRVRLKDLFVSAPKKTKTEFVKGRKNNEPVAKNLQSSAVLERQSEMSIQRRHTRRDQVYLAVRQAMRMENANLGQVRFKVLSADMLGDVFIVMADADVNPWLNPDHPSQCETRIIKTALIHYGLDVKAVYWRFRTETKLFHQAPVVDKHTRDADVLVTSTFRVPTTHVSEAVTSEEFDRFKNELAKFSGLSTRRQQTEHHQASQVGKTELTSTDDFLGSTQLAALR